MNLPDVSDMMNSVRKALYNMQADTLKNAVELVEEMASKGCTAHECAASLRVFAERVAKQKL